MLTSTAVDYAKFLKNNNIEPELEVVGESIDDMFTRLEELENMIAIVQEERGNAVGMTGSLSLILDHKIELTKLFERIDVLERVIEHSKKSLDSLESKADDAEKKLGLTETSSKLFKMITTTIFKKSGDDGNQSPRDVPEFCVDDYFTKDSDNESKQ